VPEPKSASAPAAKGKAKAKAEPKAQPPPPPPEPEPVEEMEVVKKKKNNRGGRNKAKEDPDEPKEFVPPPRTGPSGAEKAAANADKDTKLRECWEKFKTAQSADDKKNKLDALMKDIDEQMASRKVTRSKGRSDQLEQSLSELQMQGGDRELVETCTRQLEEARAWENWTALKKKFEELKAKCEEALEKKPVKPKANDDGEKKRPENQEEKREAAVRTKLAENEDKNSKLEKKVVEIDQEITRLLFSPPYRFCNRFEQPRGTFNVVLEQHPKGGKGGGKSAPKEIHVIGNSATEVEKCCKALKDLDFSGNQTKTLDSSQSVRKQLIDESEKEFNVMIFQNRQTNGSSSKPTAQLEVYGARKSVEAALKKIEENASSVLEETVPAELVKVIFAQKLLEEWRKHSPADIRMFQPEKGDKGSQAAKITITGKSKSETEEAMQKVIKFKRETTKEVMVLSEDDYATFSKWLDGGKDRSSDSLAKMFRDIRNSSSCIILRDEEKKGITLVGSKKDAGSVKASLKELFAKASYKPQTVELDFEKIKMFNRDDLNKISEECKLLSVYKEKENIVLLGDDAAVEAATAKIHEELNKRCGASETIVLSEQAFKKATAKGMPEIKGWQDEYKTSITWSKEAPYEFKIIGSAKSVEAVKKELEKFAKQADSQITKIMQLEDGEIGRVIGNGGNTLNKIRKESGAQVQCKTEATPPFVQIIGTKEQVAEAERLVEEALGKREPEAKPSKEKAAPKAETAKPPPSRASKKVVEKAPEFKNEVTEDSFPSLGGAMPVKQSAPRTWGKTKQGEAPQQEASTEEAYPALQGNAKATEEEEAKDEEVEAKAEDDEEA
jgi:rRNA processing protein Krr1/Pno1